MVDVIFDGRSLGVTPVRNGQVLRLATPVDGKLHLLEIEALVVAEVVPGAVRLVG